MARMAKVRTDTIRFITDLFFDGEFFYSINAEEGGYITLGDDFAIRTNDK